MPDESCRKCGGLLLDYAVCAKCRAPTQFICRICGTKTLKRVHEPICFRVHNHDNNTTFDFPISVIFHIKKDSPDQIMQVGTP